MDLNSWIDDLTSSPIFSTVSIDLDRWINDNVSSPLYIQIESEDENDLWFMFL